MINYNTTNLYIIYYNIDKYDSKIYNSNKIKLIILKKKKLIYKYNLLNRILIKYLKYNIEDEITNNINNDRNNFRLNYAIKEKINKIKSEILLIETKIKKIEWEENLIINTFNIYKFPMVDNLIFNLKSIFKCFN
jgi:hypothetical protein